MPIRPVEPAATKRCATGTVGVSPPPPLPPPATAGVVAPLNATSSKYQIPPSVKPAAKLNITDALS